MKRPDSGTLLIALCAILIILLSIGLGFTLRDRVGSLSADGMNALAEMEQTIRKHFYFYDEETSEDAVIDGALRGMMAGLDDPYAQYFTGAEYDAMLAEDAGDYIGVGISVATPDEQGSLIIEVYESSPAAQADVRKGDVILSVNGTPTAGLSMAELTALFSMDDAVPDVLILKRGDETTTVTIQRGAVHVNRVVSELLDGNIGYLRITEFNGSVVSDFWTAAKAFRDAGVHEMILDLRGNPGGGLTEVLGVSNYLVPKGQVIVTIKSKTEQAQVYRSEGNERLDVDLVVLADGGSASASELLIGALKDYGLATVVGTQTYGKGIVQSYYRLNSNGGWMKLTTDAYYTPNDVCIHGVGIAPDVVVELPETYRNTPIDLLPRENDTQLQAAIVRLQSYVKKTNAQPNL